MFLYSKTVCKYTNYCNLYTFLCVNLHITLNEAVTKFVHQSAKRERMKCQWPGWLPNHHHQSLRLLWVCVTYLKGSSFWESFMTLSGELSGGKKHSVILISQMRFWNTSQSVPPLLSLLCDLLFSNQIRAKETGTTQWRSMFSMQMFILKSQELLLSV